MAKITFDTVVSGFKSVTTFISNFSTIATHLNSKVLYRDNPSGEPNTMEQELDMNSNRITNLGAPQNNTDAVRLQDIATTELGTTTAVLTSVVDSGGYFDSTTTEGVLQELGSFLSGVVYIGSGEAGGTANVITSTLVPAIGGLTANDDGSVAFVNAAYANTSSSVTFNPNGAGALTIKKHGGDALLAGDIAGADHKLILQFNYDSGGSWWELLNPVNKSITSSKFVDGDYAGGLTITSTFATILSPTITVEAGDIVDFSFRVHGTKGATGGDLSIYATFSGVSTEIYPAYSYFREDRYIAASTVAIMNMPGKVKATTSGTLTFNVQAKSVGSNMTTANIGMQYTVSR